jgi:hypothetical protein
MYISIGLAYIVALSRRFIDLVYVIATTIAISCRVGLLNTQQYIIKVNRN